MLVFRAAINKMRVRIANREDPDQNASEEAFRYESALFVDACWQGTGVRNFRTFIIGMNISVHQFIDCHPRFRPRI